MSCSSGATRNGVDDDKDGILPSLLSAEITPAPDATRASSTGR